MEFRTFQSGDEVVQAEIYNQAAGALPRFVAAKTGDILRRVQDKGFDPLTRIFAVERGRPVGYVAWQTNGRMGYPWCVPGSEVVREELCTRALQSLKQRGAKRAFAAYRTDWTDVCKFFLKHGFQRSREILNFAMELSDMRVQPSSERVMTPLRESDLGAIRDLVPGMVRLGTEAELRRHFFDNPYFGPEAVFLCRDGQDPRRVAGAGIVVEKPPYADPRKIDANMPCFRLGAFGSEGMTHKRVNGLFSLLVPPGPTFESVAVDMLAHAVQLLRSANATVIAAQVPSDVPHLVAFYQKYFNRQGGFPVFEKEL
jgi:hypothetical protein